MNSMPQPDFHPDAESLSAFVEQVLPERERAQVFDHLATCSRCRQVIYLVQEAAAPVEVQGLAPVVGSRKNLNARYTGWRLAWVPVAACTAIIAVAVWLHLRPITPGTELSKIQPQSESAGRRASQPPIEAKAGTRAPAPPVPKKPAARNASHAAPGRPAREPVPGVGSSAAVFANGEQINQPSVAASPSPSPGGEKAQGSAPPEVAAQSKPEPPSAAATQDRRHAGGSGFHGYSARITQAKVSGATDRVQAGRASVSAAAPQNGAQSAPPARFEAMAPRSFAGIAAVRKVQPVKLPSGLNAISTAKADGHMLAIDMAGTLFLSQDSGRNWETVVRQWTGLATEVRIQRALNGNAAAAPNDASGAHDSNASEAAAPAAVFEMVNDGGLVWVSTDGLTWKPR